LGAFYLEFNMTFERKNETVNPAQLPISPEVIAALQEAQLALAGDSNDDEHDALLALVAALEECNLVEWQSYDAEEIVQDFMGWAGLVRGSSTDLDTINEYVKYARPANSHPVEVKDALIEWAESPPDEGPTDENDEHSQSTRETSPSLQPTEQLPKTTTVLPLEGIKVSVPTYNGKWLNENPDLPEFDEPEVPILVCPADGLRIVLGTHDYNDYSKPDIQVERRHNGWIIFLHAMGGGDPSGYVVFLDDGRSFCHSRTRCG
jgi:hypothetical protein